MYDRIAAQPLVLSMDFLLLQNCFGLHPDAQWALLDDVVQTSCQNVTTLNCHFTAWRQPDTSHRHFDAPHRYVFVIAKTKIRNSKLRAARLQR
jgi:anaerobic glycerol-3-phosphate dehydrogenase